MESGSCCEAQCPERAEVAGLPFHRMDPTTRVPPCGNERGDTDESGKEGMTPVIPSCLLRHPPGGKFNKVHIPRAAEEREREREMRIHERKDGEMERWREEEMEGWQS